MYKPFRSSADMEDETSQSKTYYNIETFLSQKDFFFSHCKYPFRQPYHRQIKAATTAPKSNKHSADKTRHYNPLQQAREHGTNMSAQLCGWNNNNDNNSIQFFIINAPSQQLQSQFQTQHSVNIGNKI
jgi:hypothetical protein